MDREEINNLSSRDIQLLQQMEQESLEESQDLKEDEQEDQYELSQELLDSYNAIEPEEKFNQFTILSNALRAPDTVKTTWLSESELGRPLFNIRFLLDMEDIAKYYIDPLLNGMKLDPDQFNAIAVYFKAKKENVTSSGMSNKGFAMNLSVTKKVDATRKRIKNITDMKGGLPKK